MLSVAYGLKVSHSILYFFPYRHVLSPLFRHALRSDSIYIILRPEWISSIFSTQFEKSSCFLALKMLYYNHQNEQGVWYHGFISAHHPYYDFGILETNVGNSKRSAARLSFLIGGSSLNVPVPVSFVVFVLYCQLAPLASQDKLPADKSDENISRIDNHRRGSLHVHHGAVLLCL